jgi:hypothetical protein
VAFSAKKNKENKMEPDEVEKVHPNQAIDTEVPDGSVNMKVWRAMRKAFKDESEEAEAE